MHFTLGMVAGIVLCIPLIAVLWRPAKMHYQAGHADGMSDAFDQVYKVRKIKEDHGS